MLENENGSGEIVELMVFLGDRVRGQFYFKIRKYKCVLYCMSLLYVFG